MAWKSFNMLMDNPRVLVLDCRPSSLYASGHIRGSVCVALQGHSLTQVAGPGPPTWSPHCWWGRHVLLVTFSRKRKASDQNVSLHHIFKFLQREGLVRSLRVLGAEEGQGDAFTSFSKSYPFLITKSIKASEFGSYPTEIVPGVLFLGDLAHATSQKCLENLQISHVLTIHTEPLRLPKSFVHMFFDLEDAPYADIAQYFEPTFEFVEKARSQGKRVLVHCGAGVSRSATLCAAYLMRINCWSVEDALKFLKEQRSKVDPNPGFLSALHNYACLLEPEGLHLAPEPVISGGNGTIWHLDIIKQGKSIGSLHLSGSTVTFGRGTDCTMVLEHASVSREHAVLTRGRNGEFLIVDNHSTHGTFVNGERMSKGGSKAVRLGDTLQFGASTRTYILCNKPLCCSSE